MRLQEMWTMLQYMKRAKTTVKTTVRKQKEVAMKSPPPFTLKIPVNIVRTLMCTGHWSWNVLNAFGTITTKVVQYAITRSPRREITSKRAFFGVTIVERLHTKTRRRWKPISLPLFKRRTRKRNIYFHPFQMAVYFTFCCSLRENTHSFVWNGDQQHGDTFISAKKWTFAPKSDSITIFAF